MSVAILDGMVLHAAENPLVAVVSRLFPELFLIFQVIKCIVISDG